MFFQTPAYKTHGKTPDARTVFARTNGIEIKIIQAIII